MTVTSRLLPLPPKAIFPFGIKSGLEEPPERVRLAAGVSTSLTANGADAMAVFSIVVWLPMAETLGAVFEAGGAVPSGNNTKALSVGPVGGAVNIAAVGLATVKPFIGNCSGLPSKVPLKTGAAKKSPALRTS